jgi:hypothetical protein
MIRELSQIQTSRLLTALREPRSSPATLFCHLSPTISLTISPTVSYSQYVHRTYSCPPTSPAVFGSRAYFFPNVLERGGTHPEGWQMTWAVLSIYRIGLERPTG